MLLRVRFRSETTKTETMNNLLKNLLEQGAQR